MNLNGAMKAGVINGAVTGLAAHWFWMGIAYSTVFRFWGLPPVMVKTIGSLSLVSNLAGEPTLDSQRSLYFTHHFSRDGVLVEADIYVARHK